jgi:HK97 family phage major capsid protein
MNALETRLQTRIERREMVQAQHEGILAEREGGDLTETEKKQIEVFRSELSDLDTEIESLTVDLESARKAEETSKAIRRAMLGQVDGIDPDGDGVVYRTMAAYARDVILTRESQEASKIRTQFGDAATIDAAAARLDLLKRTPANTLSSNVGGLQPPQHIDQIFQVINTSRALVASAQRADLNRGTLTYPSVTTRPVVAVQGTEKTEAGNTGMVIDMVTTTASTYLGGGDLSWQAVNWSTPDALDTWFRLAAADYALKTEQDAAQALQHSAFTYNISSTLAASSTFAQWMTAIGAGYADVFTNSGRVADTVYLSPDLFGSLLGLTSNAFTQFTNVSGSNIGPLNIVVSRGMDAGVAVVGDSAGLLVAETAGAPVELRVVEPAIGGFEVGIIGAFEAVVVDAGSFAMITTAS